MRAAVRRCSGGWRADRLPEIAAEERRDFADAVGPGGGVAARRRAAAAGRVGVDARRDLAHGGPAVEGVMGTRVYLDGHRIAGLPRRLGQLAAGLRGGPVILLA